MLIMKTAAVVLLIVLVVIPIIWRFSTFAAVLKGSGNNTDQSPGKIPTPLKIMRFKKWAIILGTVYGLVFFITLFWVSSFFLKNLGLETRMLVIVGIFLVILAVFVAGTMFLYYKCSMKNNPFPSHNADNKTRNEWYNRYFDFFSKNFWRIAGIYIGGIVLLSILFAIVLWLFIK
jgi:hypothetical protein